MVRHVDIAIVGAGPYGLSLAAHLRKKKADFCVFGRPMGTWRSNMPSGMFLKSEGFASNIYHPDGTFTLEDFCNESGLPYSHIGVPVSLSTFLAYGLAFQRRFVPDLEEALVVHITRDASEFQLTLDNDEVVHAHRVVIAAGITNFAYLPPMLAALPSNVVSHSSTFHSFEAFKGLTVIVVGAGASAVDVAAALHDAGAKPKLVTRRSHIPFHGKLPDKRPLIDSLRAPWSGLGPSWRSRIACDFPLLFHCMPHAFRLKVIQKHLGPAPGWFTKDKILANIPIHAGMSLVGADAHGGRVQLLLSDGDQGQQTLTADHVIAGTGYRVDVKRLPFLGRTLLSKLQTEENSPILSSNFESSVSGLYFIGTMAALSFGPLLRFAFGAGFTSSRLSRHLAASRRPQQLRKGNLTSSKHHTSPNSGNLSPTSSDAEDVPRSRSHGNDRLFVI